MLISPEPARAIRRPVVARAIVVIGAGVTLACGPAPVEPDRPISPHPAREMATALPMPRLHHVHINSVDPERSIAWYEKLWPAGEATTHAGFAAFAEGTGRYLLYTQVAAQAPGAYDRALHRSVPQSAVWTVGPGVVDTDSLIERVERYPDEFELLPIYAGPDDTTGVLRSSLISDRLQDFGYLVDPDGVLVEFNAADQDDFFGHTHYWREAPLCSMNWYAEHLGMPPAADPATGETTPPPLVDPCDVAVGQPGYPTFMPWGQIRSPRRFVQFSGGTMLSYPRQCRDGRCGDGNDLPLVPSRGQVVDHVAFAYPDLDVVVAHLEAGGVPIAAGPYPFGETRAILVDDPDGLALELIEIRP
jgi:catechol 2,3-dioxygenase-like lactoylglutathione lyase family enzyme